jgi:ComF family protein
MFHVDENNPVAKLFWGRTKVEFATAFFHFNKGSKYQGMMHKFKYHNCKEIGFVLGKYFGTSIKDSNFNKIDIIIPVPLHKSKLKKRGYNQSEWIAKGMSESLSKPIDSNTLIRKIATETQTRKSRFERWKNVDNIFGIQNADHIKGKHILLVDDVVTTGSTLEACANAILEIENTKVSIATLAVA